MKFRIGCVVVGLLSLSLFVFAQTPISTTPASASAPSLSGSGTKDYVPLWLSTTKLGSAGSALQFGTPQTLVSNWTVPSVPLYDVSPDGKKILLDRVPQQVNQSVTVITNFTAGLKK
jgi:hypothetical protein